MNDNFAPRTTRRSFLKTSTLAASAALTRLDIARNAYAGGSDAIRIGLIGAGDRGSYLMREIFAAARAGDVSITAVCDVWKKNRENAAAHVKNRFGAEPRQFTRYQDLLALRDVNAVVIATPDFSHGQILIDALEARKDVYIEKPMTIDVASANKSLDLAVAKQCVVQAGTQRRSEGQFIGAAKFAAAGALGKISRVSGAMHFNNARWLRRYDDCVAADVDWGAFRLGKLDRPFDAQLLRQWQLFKATSNGMPGLWMTHYADAVHMITGAKCPETAVALGGVLIWEDGREHADTFHALLQYSDGFIFDWAMGLGNSAGVHFTVHGTKGTLDLEKWTFTPEGKAAEAQKIPAAGGSGHVENWLRCIRSREKPNADIQFGHHHAVATIMAATALSTGQRVRWNAAKREILAG